MNKILSLSLLLAMTLGPVSPVLADDIALSFNPNYILSDGELLNAASMTREDIQAFLEERGSTLSRIWIEDKNSMRRTPADIIYRAAMENQVSPKYLLTKLQKEQSLITDPNPSQKQYDWATGYGICDNCGMDDPALQHFKGFGIQVDDAAGIMRWYFDNKDTSDLIKKPGNSYQIDGLSVLPQNLATAFLYTYTPHLRGNQNFWNLWQAWFTGLYPDGTLIKTASVPTVYAIESGKKRPIKSMAVLVSRYNPRLILTISPTTLAQYPDGAQLSFPNYSIILVNDNYYLIDGNTLRPFETESLLRKMGYQQEEIIEAADADMTDMSIGTVITADSIYPQGRLIRTIETNAVYYIKDNQYHPMFDEQIAKINFPALRVAKSSLSELQNLARGAPVLYRDGTLMGVKGSSRVYVIDHGKKRHIFSEADFKALGYQAKNIVWTDELTAGAHETGLPMFLPPQISNS